MPQSAQPLSEPAKAYLAAHHSAAMVTLRPDGSPNSVRVGVALVDGKVWSSGTPSRVRNGHLRRDPRATFFVFSSSPSWLALDGAIRVLDGPEAADMNLRLFEIMQKGMPGATPGALLWDGAPRSREEFRQIMRDEQRLIYEIEVIREYGRY